MARHFVKITLEEFKEKIEPIVNPNHGEDFDGDEFPYNLPSTVSKDLKVSCAFENWEICQDYKTKEIETNGIGLMSYPAGYYVLPNGMPALFVNAGGDWETPICFLIYWDGDVLRGYVPTKGNMWNRKTKEAFGNEELSNDEAYEICKKLLAEANWLDKATLDSALTQLESYYAQNNAEGFLNDINLTNADAIIADVVERIVEKPENTKPKKAYVKQEKPKPVKMTFTEDQKEHIEYFKEDYDIDLKKGFYWQYVVNDEGLNTIWIEPKDHYDNNGHGFDQHGSAELFLNETDSQLLGELSESEYEFEGDEAAFRTMISKYSPFFEEKIMFPGLQLQN